jgi:hypothetical protein
VIDGTTESNAKDDLDVVCDIDQVPTQLDKAQAHLDIQPKNKGGFSTGSDPMPPDSMGVGVDMRDPHKLYNKILDKYRQWVCKTFGHYLPFWTYGKYYRASTCRRCGYLVGEKINF